MTAFGLKRLDHVGVIVEDLAAARQVLEVGLGLQVDREIDDPDLQAVFLRSGDASIELVQWKDAETNRARLAGERGARIEHIAIEVEELAATVRALGSLGIQATAAPRRRGAFTSIWTVPESSGGIKLQFMERIRQP